MTNPFPKRLLVRRTRTGEGREYFAVLEPHQAEYGDDLAWFDFYERTELLPPSPPRFMRKEAP